MNKQQQSGFTIVELLIAASVFSSVLLIITFGLINIAKTYYKGVTTTRTQEVAREVMNDLSQSIQLSGGIVYGPTQHGNNWVICAGGKKYTYTYRQVKEPIDDLATQAHHGMVVQSVPLCTAALGPDPSFSASGAIPDSRELIGRNMRVANINLERLPGGGNVYRLDVRILYGDQDLLEDSDDADTLVDRCRSNVQGSEFCAVSELSTIIDKRVQ